MKHPALIRRGSSRLDRALDVPAVRLVALAVLLAATVALERAGLVPLDAWTGPIVPRERLPWLAACILAAAVATELAPGRWRRVILLAASLAAMAILDVGFACLSVAFLAAYYAVLCAPVHRGFKLVFLLGCAAALAGLCNERWAPDVGLSRPTIAWLGYALAMTYTFRLASFHYEMSLRRFARVRLDDYLLYFTFAPFSMVVPYMLAIPRFRTFGAAMARRDRAVEASGIRILALGLALSVGRSLAVAVWDPQAAMQAHARAGEWVELWTGLVYYPVDVVLRATAVACILTGLVRALGVGLAPAFDRPLAAESVLEWWRRWNTHFRQLLVDLFFYPVMLRLRRADPTVAIVAGCASVFLVGSTLFHAPKRYFALGTYPIDLGLVVENAAFFAVVAAGLGLERSRRARGVTGASIPRGTSPWSIGRALRILRTWIIVAVIVVGLGHGVGWAVDERPAERATARIAAARALRRIGRELSAADRLRAEIPTLRALVERRPRDPVRRLQLALALGAPGPGRDLAAAAAELRAARPWLDPSAPLQRDLVHQVEIGLRSP